MGHRGVKIFAAAATACLIAAPGWAKTDYHSGIWNLLRAGGLCFAENGDSRAWQAGAIDAGGKHYEIWGYAWEETPRSKTGSTEHASYRVLVFEKEKTKLTYRGNYTVDGGVPFQVQGRTIKFDYERGRPGEHHEFGDEISFSDSGPPKKVVLDGELHDFDLADHKICTFK